jgi:integrase
MNRVKVKNYPGIYSHTAKDGTKTYSFQYRDPATRKQRWETRSTLKAANEAYHAKRSEVASGHTTPSRVPTLAQFVEDIWKPNVANRVALKKLQQSTATLNESDTRKHLLPALGTFPLNRIEATHIEDLQTRLLASGLSAHTVRRVTNTLSGILKLARRRKLVTANVVEDVDKPHTEARRATIPTLDQVHALAAATPSRTLRVMILTAALTGMRQSELFGLRWTSIDTDAQPPTMRVVEQHYRGETKTRAKTPQGLREFPIPDFLADELRLLSAEQQIDGQPNPYGLVFPTPSGRYWPARRFQDRWAGVTRDGKRLKGIRDRAGLPHLRFHDLRSFFVSEVRASGLPSSFTKQLVGHSDDRTHDGYTRPTKDQAAAIAAALNDRFTARDEA